MIHAACLFGAAQSFMCNSEQKRLLLRARTKAFELPLQIAQPQAWCGRRERRDKPLAY